MMKRFWQAFSSDDSGQGLVEYALIIALVAVGLIAILLVLRNSIGNVFNNAATQLTTPRPIRIPDAHRVATKGEVHPWLASRSHSTQP